MSALDNITLADNRQCCVGGDLLCCTTIISAQGTFFVVNRDFRPAAIIVYIISAVADAASNYNSKWHLCIQFKCVMVLKSFIANILFMLNSDPVGLFISFRHPPPRFCMPGSAAVLWGCASLAKEEEGDEGINSNSAFIEFNFQRPSCVRVSEASAIVLHNYSTLLSGQVKWGISLKCTVNCLVFQLSSDTCV